MNSDFSDQRYFIRSRSRISHAKQKNTW